MTDEEILLDFYTHAEQQEEIKREQIKRYEVEEEEELPEAPSPQVVPASGSDHNRVKTTSVRANRSEFIRWYEAEIGPWPTQP